MMVLHGVCVGSVHREGDKVVPGTGEVKHWSIDLFKVFDGNEVRECRLAESFGQLAVGEVVTASVALDSFRDEVQVRLVDRVTDEAVRAFSPELAQLLVGAGLGAASGSDQKPSRAA